jgi:hypothetical protein
MVKSNLSFVAMALLLVIDMKAQESNVSREVNFCDVVEFPEKYDRQVLSVDVILRPSEHALYLYGERCVPKEGYNVTTLAILPPGWESMPNGRKLTAILRKGRPAKVRVMGTFENDEQRYGPHPSRFRFSISKVNSVTRVG